MPYYRAKGLPLTLVAGFVGVIGPKSNPNYFTGVGYSCEIDDAKVFRTTKGTFTAMRYWQEADYNRSPLPLIWYEGRRAQAVKTVPENWAVYPGDGKEVSFDV